MPTNSDKEDEEVLVTKQMTLSESQKDSSATHHASKANNEDESNRVQQYSFESFFIVTFAMFFFFGIHNYLQEAMMNVKGFEYGVMLGFMEVLGVTVCSAMERKFIAKETGRVAPIKSYPLLTFCLMSSSSLSNLSLNYINFPTKVVFRSCKLLPTMMFATCINRRIFSSIEYVCALFVCTGLVLFASADWRLTPTFNPFGLLFVAMSVIADAIFPNLQERLFRRGSSRLEVTVYTNFFTLIAMTFTTIASGDLVAIVKHAMRDSQLATYMIVYTTISYLAISSFMIIVKRYGAVTGVLLATARKAMTLILSFIFFPKAFSWCYVFGSIFVLGGLLISSLFKQRKQIGAIFDSFLNKTKEIEMSNIPDMEKAAFVQKNKNSASDQQK